MPRPHESPQSPPLSIVQNRDIDDDTHASHGVNALESIRRRSARRPPRARRCHVYL